MQKTMLPLAVTMKASACNEENENWPYIYTHMGGWKWNRIHEFAKFNSSLHQLYTVWNLLKNYRKVKGTQEKGEETGKKAGRLYEQRIHNSQNAHINGDKWANIVSEFVMHTQRKRESMLWGQWARESTSNYSSPRI